ncbi:MAG TPA: RNA polymerase sigma factor RpoD/SigA [Gemmatimonadaceae bacterium]|nr:RNA polymerase sigma factor RpoD/SigA [Gemmatimonadaceae bacterium]
MEKVASTRSRHSIRSSGGSTFDQYLADIKRLPLIGSVAEERALARLAQQGDVAAAERLVTANLRFVISYVKKYQGHGLDLAELVAIGNEGLLKAVRKFDPDQGVKFISYAVWWVRQAVLKALAEQTRSIRVPLNQNSALLRMAKAEQILAIKLNREPTDAELGQMINEDADTVRAQRQMTTSETSLDAPVDKSDRDASTLGERFSISDGGDIEEATDERMMRVFVKEAIQKHLTVRERQILTMYYGLDDKAEPMTLERIGDLLGVTRERIRQIRERAFEKLRESADGNALAGFWQVA